MSASPRRRKRTRVTATSPLSSGPERKQIPVSTSWSRPERCRRRRSASASSRRLPEHRVLRRHHRVRSQHPLPLHRPGLHPRVVRHPLVRVPVGALLHPGHAHGEAHAELFQDRPPLGRPEGRIRGPVKYEPSGFPKLREEELHLARRGIWTVGAVHRLVWPRARSPRGSSPAQPRAGSSRRSAGAPPSPPACPYPSPQRDGRCPPIIEQRLAEDGRSGCLRIVTPRVCISTVISFVAAIFLSPLRSKAASASPSGALGGIQLRPGSGSGPCISSSVSWRCRGRSSAGARGPHT